MLLRLRGVGEQDPPAKRRGQNPSRTFLGKPEREQPLVPETGEKEPKSLM
ncbi:MAG: hypothetical protein R3C02_07795 [Planctomycetaceae bacterium]